MASLSRSEPSTRSSVISATLSANPRRLRLEDATIGFGLRSQYGACAQPKVMRTIEHLLTGHSQRPDQLSAFSTSCEARSYPCSPARRCRLAEVYSYVPRQYLPSDDQPSWTDAFGLVCCIPAFVRPLIESRLNIAKLVRRMDQPGNLNLSHHSSGLTSSINQV